MKNKILSEILNKMWQDWKLKLTAEIMTCNHMKEQKMK